MNCHKNKNNNNKTHNPMKHMLHMIICCGLPLLIISVLPLLKFLSPSAKALVASITPFICPIMMMFMIPMMFKNMGKGKDCCGNSKEEIVPSETIKDNN